MPQKVLVFYVYLQFYVPANIVYIQDSCTNVKHGFLKKLHQYLKDHTLHHKYASGYALFSVESARDVLAEVRTIYDELNCKLCLLCYMYNTEF